MTDNQLQAVRSLDQIEKEKSSRPDRDRRTGRSEGHRREQRGRDRNRTRRARAPSPIRDNDRWQPRDDSAADKRSDERSTRRERRRSRSRSPRRPYRMSDGRSFNDSGSFGRRFEPWEVPRSTRFFAHDDRRGGAYDYRTDTRSDSNREESPRLRMDEDSREQRAVSGNHGFDWKHDKFAKDGDDLEETRRRRESMRSLMKESADKPNKTTGEEHDSADKPKDTADEEHEKK